MTRKIDIGGRQGRGNPPARHEIDDDGYLIEREHGGPLTALMLAVVIVCLCAATVLVACDPTINCTSTTCT